MIARRILFLNPPSVVEESMIQFLVSAQYEAAVVRDHRKLPALLDKFPRAIVYFNIDAAPSEAEWERHVRAVIEGRDRHGATVGVLTYNDSPELARKYLMNIGVDCGFIVLKLGFQESARILLRALDAAEAKGGRQYLRVKAPVGKASLNLSLNGSITVGTLEDISVVGMACYLPIEFSNGTTLNGIQLRLWGSLVLVNGTVAGTRYINTRRLSVIMFDQPVPPATRGKLFTFVRRVIQFETDQWSQ